MTHIRRTGKLEYICPMHSNELAPGTQGRMHRVVPFPVTVQARSGTGRCAGGAATDGKLRPGSGQECTTRGGRVPWLEVGDGGAGGVGKNGYWKWSR